MSDLKIKKIFFKKIEWFEVYILVVWNVIFDLIEIVVRLFYLFGFLLFNNI